MRHRGSAAGFIGFHDEDQGYQAETENRQSPEHVDVGEHGGLALRLDVDHAVGLPHGVHGAQVQAMGKRSGDSRKVCAEVAIEGRQPADQNRLMKLRAVVQHGLGDGDAEAAAECKEADKVPAKARDFRKS